MNDKQIVISLRKASTHHLVRHYFKSAGLIDVIEFETMKHMTQQMKKLILKAREKRCSQGHTSDEQRSLVNAILLATATTPPPDDESNMETTTSTTSSNPSRKLQFELLGIPKTTANRNLKRLENNRRGIRQGIEESDWSLIVKKKGWRKVSNEIREAIDYWIRQHPMVIHSPIAWDTVLVRDPATNNKVRKNKLILQCSIRELHCDLYRNSVGLPNLVVVDGKNLVSETMFRALLPPELRKMNNHYQEMCLCGPCHSFSMQQSPLNRYQMKHL